MTLSFIQACDNDRAYLLSLRKLTMLEHFEKSGQFLTDSQHAFRLNDAYDCFYLIYHGDDVIGALKYQEMPDFFEIMQLQIHPNYQGKGFGSKVMHAIIEQAGSKYLTLTVLKANPAIKLYQRLGFIITGEDEFEYWMRK